MRAQGEMDAQSTMAGKGVIFFKSWEMVLIIVKKQEFNLITQVPQATENGVSL